MADSILALDKLRRKVNSFKEQYYYAMSDYCYIKEGIEHPTENQTQEKIVQLSKLSPSEKITLINPIGFKVSKFFLDSAWSKVIAFEDQYYQQKAIYFLYQKGIEQPTERELKEEIKALSHIELRKTIFLSRPLNEREIGCIHQASYGRGVKETAKILGLSQISVKKYRSTACIQLRCENIYETISIATQLGYLPIKAKQLPIQHKETEEVENASI